MARVGRTVPFDKLMKSLEKKKPTLTKKLSDKHKDVLRKVIPELKKIEKESGSGLMTYGISYLVRSLEKE